MRIDIEVDEEEGNGSGLVVDDGRILTCEHIVRPYGREPSYIRVPKNDVGYYVPEIVHLDQNRDVAVLRVKELQSTLSTQFKAFNDVHVGDRCIVMGYPLKISHLTVLDAMISAKGEYLVPEFPYRLIQIDARVNKGNSGGPVIDVESGQIIGIVSMKYIPFLKSVGNLQGFVRELQKVVKSAGTPSGGIMFGHTDWDSFFDYANESFKRVADALMIVQVGLGWVIPTDHFLSFLD